MEPGKKDKYKITRSISQKTGMHRDDVSFIVDKFCEEVRLEMQAGNNVQIKNFGHFIVKTKPKKRGFDIHKREAVMIPAHCSPVFKPCKAFVDEVKKLDVDKGS